MCLVGEGGMGEVGGRGGWAARSRLYLSLGHRQQCCVFRNIHHPQDRPRQLLPESSLAPHTFLLMPFTSSTTLYTVHLYGLTGSAKSYL